ncbi:MAG: oxygen-dependent coproporphyrinogen oxidase [Opitutaceae bacterium]|nr:oxygen-dependent coproporphyrinogen oxidase [Cytophagales bacterium]
MEKKLIAERFKALQNSICLQVEKEDGKGTFQSDIWTRTEGGGGDTKILTNGLVLEKGGVLFSEVYGPVSDKMKSSFDFQNEEFYATGVSIVMHPSNPFVPIIHMNIRYFETGTSWWFGGGIDLTPIYIDEKEAKYFHQKLKDTCDKTDFHFYSKFKDWADNYFFLPHRNETRGIGGIFFDRLTTKNTGKTKEEIFDFVIGIGETFAPVYTQIMNTKKNIPYSEKNKEWQGIRRSRYVEFNLLYDKGTKFGLESDGRVESILMSMPPLAQWPYNYKPAENSLERKTLDLLVKNKAWI